MPQKHILAVAINDTPVNLPGINANPPPAAVRPYINGLINALPDIGADPGYVVDYYERPESGPTGLDAVFDANPDPDVVFCMSVRVVQHAQRKYPATKLIVGVVSDHTRYNLTNVTGYSADRVDAAVYGYFNFWLTAPDLTAVYVLHHAGHAPSNAALARIQTNHPAGGPRAPNVVHVEEALGTITAQLDAAGIPGTAGVFVLPIDRCFGRHQEIINWQNDNNVPTFWPVTDWVDGTAAGAFGGYGVPQEFCGERMGAKIAAYWGGTPIPIPWEDWTPTTGFKWIASRNTARALGVNLGSPGLQII